MDISVIFVSYNTAALTIKSLDALYASELPYKMEAVVIDNASRDHSVALLKEKYPHVPLIENKVNVGFGRANNQALPIISGRYVLLLNTDAFVEKDTLAKTVAYMDAHPECGILGVKLLGETQDLQPSCRYFPTPLNIFLNTTGLSKIFKGVRLIDDMDWAHDEVRSCDWVPGCYYLIRKEAIDQVGMFDPRYFMYCEEVDHCFATKKAGWEIVYYPIPVLHIGGQSAKTDSEITQQGRQIKSLQMESELLYFRKNHGMAAVLVHLLLTNLADTIHIAKSLLRLQPLSKTWSFLKHSCVMWQMFFKTKCAKTSTR